MRPARAQRARRVIGRRLPSLARRCLPPRASRSRGPGPAPSPSVGQGGDPPAPGRGPKIAISSSRSSASASSSRSAAVRSRPALAPAALARAVGLLQQRPRLALHALGAGARSPGQRRRPGSVGWWAAHAELAHHAPGQGGGPGQVVGGAGGRARRRTAPRRRGRPSSSPAAPGSPGGSTRKRSSPGREIVTPRAWPWGITVTRSTGSQLREQVPHQGVADLVVGHQAPLVVGQQPVAALGAGGQAHQRAPEVRPARWSGGRRGRPRRRPRCTGRPGRRRPCRR